MENHIRLLGILNIAVGALNGLVALIQIVFFGGALVLSTYLDLNTVATSVWLWAMLVLMLPGIVTGIALLFFRDWARWVGIVLAICQLLSVPLGTIIGFYGLWVLFSDDTDMIFTRRYGEYPIGRR